MMNILNIIEMLGSKMIQMKENFSFVFNYVLYCEQILYSHSLLFI